jgi:hypothetical protein
MTEEVTPGYWWAKQKGHLDGPAEIVRVGSGPRQFARTFFHHYPVEHFEFISQIEMPEEE